MPEITQDHDLLIRVDENVRNMNARLDTMQRDNAAQIAELRNTKVDLKDYEEYRREVDKRFIDAAHYGSESLSEYKSTMNRTVDDFRDVMKKQGEKLDGITVRLAIATGVVAVITFIAPYIWTSLTS
jgi:hypothetical protein